MVDATDFKIAWTPSISFNTPNPKGKGKDNATTVWTPGHMKIENRDFIEINKWNPAFVKCMTGLELVRIIDSEVGVRRLLTA